MPEHLATIRIVHDVHTGAAASKTFAVDLTHTQYVIFYVVGDALSYVMSTRAAGLVLITVYMLGMVAAMHELLTALGRDGRLALLLVPILPNTQFLIGLLQFLMGIPFMLYGWALALRFRRTGRNRELVLLAIVAILIFYSHVVAFGLFGIGLAIIAPWRNKVRYWLSVVPSGLLCIHWALFTASGNFVINATTSGPENKDLWPFYRSFHLFYDIALDTYRDSADEKIFVQLMVVAVAMVVLARRDQQRDKVVSTLRWLIIPAICFALYFRSEGTNGFLGHIRDRFAIVGLFALIPALRMPRGMVGHAATIAMVVTAAMATETLNWHFNEFEKREVGDFGRALEHIPEGKRVAGLMFKTESKQFYQNPFLHFPEYYLIERGGTVNFSFAGYPHWAYRYLPHKDPLGASPPVFLWEWQPERVAIQEELAASYDYVLTRGPGFDPPVDVFYKVFDGTGEWRVWKRREHE